MRSIAEWICVKVYIFRIYSFFVFVSGHIERNKYCFINRRFWIDESWQTIELTCVSSKAKTRSARISTNCSANNNNINKNHHVFAVQFIVISMPEKYRRGGAALVGGEMIGIVCCCLRRVWCWMNIIYFVCALLLLLLPPPPLWILLLLFEKSTRLHSNYREKLPLFSQTHTHTRTLVSFCFAAWTDSGKVSHITNKRISFSLFVAVFFVAFENYAHFEHLKVYVSMQYTSQIECNAHLSCQADKL